MKEGSGSGESVFVGALLGEPGVGTPLMETLKDTERKALDMGISLHRDPTGEPGRGHIY